MGKRIPLFSAALVLLLAWLAAAAVTLSADNPYVLEVPAATMSVGQQFQARLVSLAPDAATPADEIALQLSDSGGHLLARASANLNGAAVVSTDAMSLPRAGTYTLRASGHGTSQAITLHALPEPAVDFGGVMSVATLGLPSGAEDYLRQHGFAATSLAPDATDAPLVVIGDPRLPELEDRSALATRYTQLWKLVAAGGSALALEPPPPGVADFWPNIAPLIPPPTAGTAACTSDALASPFTDGLTPDPTLATLLSPALIYDLAQAHLDLYHWNGYLLPRLRPHAGYTGCHALLTFRLGNGWVTVSTLPLLAHLQDVRARMVLMNLIASMSKRLPVRRRLPPSPGLAWVLSHKPSSASPAASVSAAAVWYRPPPQPIEPAAVLVPLTAAACWQAPSGASRGATVTLDLAAPLAAAQLDLNFGSDPARQLSAYDLEATSNGQAWTALPTGSEPVALPSGRVWRQFRVRVLEAPAHWRLCDFSVH